MKGNIEDVAFNHYLRQVAERSGANIEQSGAFLSILSGNYKSDPKAVLEFGIAVLLDKPIYLLIPEGTPIAENVKRLARGVAFFKKEDPDSLKAATERLLGLARGDGGG